MQALLTAYTRRKRWEYRQLAVSIVNTLGEAMSKPDAGGQVSLRELSMMGFKVTHGNAG